MKHGFYRGDDGTLYLEWETADGLACSLEVNADGSEMYFVCDGVDPGGAEPVTWRVGDHYGIHVYEHNRPVATFHNKADALRAVQSVNRSIPARTYSDDEYAEAMDNEMWGRYARSVGIAMDRYMAKLDELNKMPMPRGSHRNHVHVAAYAPGGLLEHECP